MALLHAAGAPGCAGSVNTCEGPDCSENEGCTARGECSFARHCALVTCDDGRWVCAYDDEQGAYRWLLEGQGAAKDCAYVTPPCTRDGGCPDGACSAPCTQAPPNDCKDSQTLVTYGAAGSCIAGSCDYPATEVPCPGGCADGKCVGDPCQGVSCDRPHATGGACVDGACQGFSCESGWGNCDGDWNDGCETALTTTSNCGSCGQRCSGADHATASCKSGSCALSCTAPWSDCDGNAANGCEIPVGVANRCDRSGLNSTRGCGTAHCGAGNGSTSQESFGSWHCTFCTHCHLWPDGYSWCLQSSGLFSADRCASCCNAAQADLVCTP